VEIKGLAHTMQASNEKSISVRDIASSTDSEVALQMCKASSISVNGIGYKPLRVVRLHLKIPLRIVQKLNERYAYSTLSSRLSLMWQLNGLKYQKGKDMGDFIDSFASILDRLESMDVKIDEDLYVVMLVENMNGQFEFT
jgi:gag-polypeptide of LTR copia-type